MAKCYTYKHNTKSRTGCLEARVLAELEKPYPDKSGLYLPEHGSDINHLVEALNSSQPAISRALNNLHRKRQVARMKPVWDAENQWYTIDRRLQTHGYLTELPHYTKSWWVLVSQLRPKAVEGN